MFDVQNRLGVQSWCFRAFKPIPDLLKQVNAIGLRRVEVCGVHMNFDDESTWDAPLQAFADAGVQITSIGVQGFANNPAREENWFKFARRAGADMVAASFRIETTPDAYHSAEKLAEKYDLVLGLHNHGGYDPHGSSAMLANVFRQTGPRVGLCLDTAWMMQSGEDPLKIAERFKDRLHGIHVKDFIFNRAGKWEDVVVGTGNLKLPELLALADSAPICRTITLEYEGDEANPGPKLAECVDKIRNAG